MSRSNPIARWRCNQCARERTTFLKDGSLQQKDNEMKSGGSRIVQSKVDTKQPKVAQTLSTFINKISRVTNKSINK
jgi:hypothetical protein